MKIKKIITLAICLAIIVFVGSIVYALNTVDTGFKVDFGQTATIDEWGICKNVTRTSSGDIFIPTKTQAEWETFINNANGVTFADCTFCIGTPTVTDIDGNVYNTVQIGTQCWMKENLKVTKNPAGSTITRYCYNDDLNICNTDGGLYTWIVAMSGSKTPGDQGICPDDWYVPLDSDWYTLESFLTDYSDGATCISSRDNSDNYGWDCANAGLKLKLGGSSGFDAIIAGFRSNVIGFNGRGVYALWWSSDWGGPQAWRRQITTPGYGWDNMISRNMINKPFAHSVRCIKN